MNGADTLLEVRNLVTRFHTDQGVVRAVNGVSFAIGQGEALAIVGESGSGKSVTVLSLLGLIPSPPGRIERGEAIFEGSDLLKLPRTELRLLCGTRVAMIFQDPMTSLNPVLTVGYQIGEVLQRHCGLPRNESRRRAAELLETVGIPDARARLRSFPHQFSGGQRQRIMIAMALAGEPAILIADEPTTALDVTIQAQIVQLIQGLRRRLGMAVIWITHDLALVAGLVDRILVMYAGLIVEEAPVRLLYQRPRHPYTLGLLRSIPRGTDRRQRLQPIPGSPPDARQKHPGCPFVSRCEWAVEKCRQENPPLLPAGPGQRSACWQIEALNEAQHGG